MADSLLIDARLHDQDDHSDEVESDSSDEDLSETMKGERTKKEGVNSNLSNQKKNSKKKNKQSKSDSERQDVVYVGHLPHDLSEAALRQFLSQFGRVRRLRLSRSARSGNSRGYAYSQFETPEIAQIVADTLQGYILMGRPPRRLVCHLVSSPHPRLFFTHVVRNNANKQSTSRQTKPARTLQAVTKRLVEREQRKRQQIKEMLGDDSCGYDFPGFETTVAKSHDSSDDGAKKSTGKAEKTSRDKGSKFSCANSSKVLEIEKGREIQTDTPSPKKQKRISVSAKADKNKNKSSSSKSHRKSF